MNAPLRTPTPTPLSRDPSGAFRSVWVLLSIGLLYVSFGVCFGLLEFGVPPIMMTHGVDLASMGWVIALYIPFGLTFLWAPLIDSRALPWLGYRIGWIVASQCVSSALLVLVAFGSDLPATGLFVLGLGTCFAVATMDLALDALAVDIIGPNYRALAAGLKVGALALGGLIGGGVLVGMFDRLTWTGTFLLAAGLPILTMLPVLTLIRADKPRSNAITRPSVLVTLRRPGIVRQITLLSLITSATISLVYFQRPILVQMGVPLTRIGWELGTLAPLLNTAAAVMIAPLLSLASPVKSLAFLVAASAIAAAGMVWGVSHGSVDSVMSWALAQGMASSALSVIIYTLILKWSARGQSATDYAVLCGSSRLLTTLILMAVPPALPYLSWGMFYVLCVVALTVLAWLIRHEVRSLDDRLPT